MSEQEFEPLGTTLLVHVQLPQAESQEDLEELYRLAESAGGEVGEAFVCKRQAPDPRTFIGKGKVLEIADAVRAYDAKVVIFNSSLTPAQERNLEKDLDTRVMDRVALILDIFARRARTYEGKLQVELARLKYAQARLVRGWTHLERQKGGFGLRGGPGETQIELDRRAIRERIAAVLKDLEVVGKRREQNRQARKKNAIPVVSFVGYTNAGKSTLFNKLTNAGVFAEDLLFATLDPTLRTLELPVVGKVVFADTVGFIRHLPHDLVAAFSATLEESCQADLLVHIIDAADPRVEDNIKAVDAVLKQIGAVTQPRLLVFNKSDLLENPSQSPVLGDDGLPVRVNVSAKTGFGIETLMNCIKELLLKEAFECEVKVSYEQGKLRSLLYAQNAVLAERYDEEDGLPVLKICLSYEDGQRINKITEGALFAAIQGQNPFLTKTVAQKSSEFNDNEFNFNFGELKLHEYQ